ncbi:MAG: aldo/keto reductase [Verrucomicrobia bacterium]|nr:aldo/keto reductase [Verrucomicrobiota bacterium]
MPAICRSRHIRIVSGHEWNNIATGMKNRLIPGTGLRVSPVCLGTMTFGTPVGETDAIRLIHEALDHGVNFIDTANIYEGYTRVIGSAGGVAEEILGRAIVGRRGQAIIATKLGMKVGDAPEDEGTSAAAIRKHLALSLKRLAVDCIDIYYLHKFDPAASMTETLAEIAAEMRDGKIRHYGVSNYSAPQLRELLATADANGLPRPVICQPPLSLLKPEVLNDLLPLCEKEQIGVAPYQVLQGGLLTGKYRRGEAPPAGSRKAEKDAWVWALDENLFQQLDGIQKKADKAGVSMSQYAIQWVLNQKAVVSAIIGVKRIEQLKEAIVAVRH